MSSTELKKYIKKQLEQSSPWDSAESDIAINDIDEKRLIEYVLTANKEGRIDWRYSSIDDALTRLSLIKNGRLLNTAKVMFSTRPDLELQMAVFASERRLTFLDISNATGTIKELVDAGELYVKKTIQWRAEFGDGMERTEVPEIPVEAIREALMNSFAHRLWNNGQNNEIAIYKDRVEIYNPGTFPDEVSPEDYINETARPIQRNPLLAQTMYYPRYIEHFGTGLLRIHDACADAGVKYKFRREKLGFTVIFYRPKDLVLDPVTGKPLTTNKPRYSENYGGINFGLNTVQASIVQHMRTNPSITTQQIADDLKKTRRSIEYHIEKLKKAGILEREGAKKDGRWIVVLPKE